VVPLDGGAGAFGLTPADVLAELERREGLSGLEEFALRKAQQREQEGS
jgi:phosphoribosyl-ATP pyrophosphohydrolase